MSFRFNKPVLTGPAFFEAQTNHADPGEAAAAGHRVATLLVRGPINDDDQRIADRVLHLADTEGIGTIAQLWSHAPADTLAGCLWRLYLLRAWVHQNRETASREFAVGRIYAPVREVLAGVVDPPGPEEVVSLVDTVVRGIIDAEFDDILERASAFAHIVAVGRGQLDSADPQSAARLADMAAELRRAAHIERTVGLH